MDNGAKPAQFLVRISDPDLKAIEYHPCDDHEEVIELIEQSGYPFDPVDLAEFIAWAEGSCAAWQHDTLYADEAEFEVIRLVDNVKNDERPA